ncbi:putative ribonuclease H-like domain-containing protein, partial [Tanacetum coccineum]
MVKLNETFKNSNYYTETANLLNGKSRVVTEAMQEELLQFKLLNVWTLVDLPYGKKAIEFPNKVYKVEKALYGLHQAPRAWYETLSNYLFENRFRRGTIDKTLFIKKIKNDILLVQVYVDDIIFGSTKKSLSTEFEQLMHKRFQMSSMRELTFFLGLQVEQRKDDIFLSQDKYVSDILKKFGFSSVKTASTPMETHKPLSKDSDGINVDVHLYRSMIGSLMYLTSSRPDIMFVVCACSRFQVQPKASHMHAVKRIFRYLKGQPTLGIWYPKDSPMDLIAYSDSDYAGTSLDRKSTTGGCEFLDLRTKAFDVTRFQLLIASIVDYTSWILKMECKNRQVMKMGLELKDKKELAIPGQTTTGKEFSNPLMAGSLPKTIKFHQIVDFLSSCSINYALTVSPTIYASYIEQFWNTVTSKIVNSVNQIHVIVDGKAVVISESSVRSDHLFDDEDGVTCLTNDEIFENLALMGYEQISTKLTFQKAPQTEVSQAVLSQIVFHDAHIEQIPPSPTTYQRNRKTHKHRRTKKDTELPQTSVPLDHEADEVLDLEKEKDAQAVKILNLKKRVKKLERKRKSSISHPRRRKYRQVETSSDDDLDEEDASKQSWTPPTTTTVFDDEDVTMVMAQTLIKMKEQKAKEKGVDFRDEEEPPRLHRSITTLQPLPTIDPKHKGKGVLVEEEPV